MALNMEDIKSMRKNLNNEFKEFIKVRLYLRTYENFEISVL